MATGGGTLAARTSRRVRKGILCDSEFIVCKPESYGSYQWGAF
jgi:hypothetical protein